MLTGSNFQELVSYFCVASWLFYFLAASTVIVLRFKEPELKRPFRLVLILLIMHADVRQNLAARPCPLLHGGHLARHRHVCGEPQVRPNLRRLHPRGHSGYDVNDRIRLLTPFSSTSSRATSTISPSDASSRTCTCACPTWDIIVWSTKRTRAHTSRRGSRSISTAPTLRTTTTAVTCDVCDVMWCDVCGLFAFAR